MMKTWSTIAGVLLLSGTLWGTEYFVDAENGNDARPGTSPETAWKSLAKAGSSVIQPGDTVRLRCGSVWRESLKPASGAEGRPVTYTRYGKGKKPLLLGSVSASSPEDWQEIKPGIWATAEPSFQPTGTAVNARGIEWSQYQERGAVDTASTVVETDDGPIFRLECKTSGKVGNKLQVWGKGFSWAPLGDAKQFVFRFCTRSTKPFTVGGLRVRRGGKPFTIYAPGCGFANDTEWQEHRIPFSIISEGDDPCFNFHLGGGLPDGAVFEIQALDFTPVSFSGFLPLNVDVGNIIFDGGAACGWRKWFIETLERPLDYFYDTGTSRVFLRHDGNPAEKYKNIELALKRHIISQGGRRYITYDGLELRYGAAHGIGGAGTAHIAVRNCDISYIGGAINMFRPNGRSIRFGNGIEFWGGASDSLVENCRLWEIYDAALTNQGGDHTRKSHPHYVQRNITYRSNVIWNCEYSFEYFGRSKNALIENIHFVNNTCVNAGFGWGHAQRPDPNGAHFRTAWNTAKHVNFTMTNNIFANTTEVCMRAHADYDWAPGIHSDYNLIYDAAKSLIRTGTDGYVGTADFAVYQEQTGREQHSLVGQAPKFVDPERCDYRLAPDSPGQHAASDGGPLGASGRNAER